MRAVDTNVLARYYLADDPAQSRIAKQVLEAGDIFVPKTVVLELAWVLESVAGQPEPKVQECLRHLVALPGVTVEGAEEVLAALDLQARGLDFADALHVCASSACDELVTFDDRFVRRMSRTASKIRVVLPTGPGSKPRGIAQKRARYRVARRAGARTRA